MVDSQILSDEYCITDGSTIKLGDRNILARRKLTDCGTGAVVSYTNVISQEIIFVRPDGTSFSKPAVINGEFIEYVNKGDAEASIIDQVGPWEILAKVTTTAGVEQIILTTATGLGFFVL